MTTLLDTSALAVFLRRRTLHEQVARAVGDELTAGRGLVSVVTAAELLVGARDAAADLWRSLQLHPASPVE